MNTRTDTPLPATDYENDLQRLGELASLVAAAQDALSDDMVSRLASALSEGITLLDRLTRNEGLMRLLQVLDRSECQYVLTSLADAISKMSRELATAPPARGGITGLLKLAREPGTQEGLRALSLLGKHWNHSLRELHRHGG